MKTAILTLSLIVIIITAGSCSSSREASYRSDRRERTDDVAMGRRDRDNDEVVVKRRRVRDSDGVTIKRTRTERDDDGTTVTVKKERKKRNRDKANDDPVLIIE